MRILVISSTPWDISNSFGNTFSNLFSGMENVEIYNICCRNGENNNDVVREAIQATDKSILKSIYKLGYDPFWKMEIASQSKENQEISEAARKKRKPIYFFIRDMIWKMGRFKKSKALNSFLESIKPDLIYLPIYAQHYMCDFQSYIVDKLNVPVVGHISDDVYGMKPNIKGFEKSRRKKLQKKIEALIKKCSYLEVFAKNMAKEYSQQFGVPCYLIGKGIKAEEISKLNKKIPKDRIKLIYTGVLSGYRFETMMNIGKALKNICINNEIQLDVYSQTILTDEMEQELNQYPHINFKGKISRDEVDRVQCEADMLLHIEGFNDEAIHSSKMSFSTKIIDYMLKNRVIFAVGCEEINSISVLNEQKLAVVATSIGEIQEQLARIINGEIDFDEILSNVNCYLKTERNIQIIQDGMKNRMEGLLRD
ncbi:MAG: glycosyltransferase [Clostridia bacterium]|nr:glycosyltransferase [Clostridia bacterium]